LSVDGQLLINHSLAVHPAASVQTYQDYWGAQVEAFDVHGAHRVLEIVSLSTVDTPPMPEPVPGMSWDVVLADDVQDRYSEYLAPTAYVDDALADDQRAAIVAEMAASPTPWYAGTLAVAAVRDRITYTAGVTPGIGSANATADSETVLTFINLPLAVLLAGFSAEAQADRVLVQWDTVSEMGNLGFNLWRGVSPDEPDTQLNTSLIPSQAPGSTQGYSYEWTDQANLVAGTTYYYWLESVDANGPVTRHGPVSATLSVPTAVALGDLSASPASAGPMAWGLPALLASLGAAAALARRRHR
jgi:hypothetical protein